MLVEQEAGEVAARQHAQRQRRDEEPQRECKVWLFEQLEIDANARAEEHRQPQEPAPLLGVELRRKRPARAVDGPDQGRRACRNLYPKRRN